MEPIDSKVEAVTLQGTGGAKKVASPKGLLPKDLRKAGLLETSDVEGLLQLLFHLGCLAVCMVAVNWCYSHGRWGLLLLVELPFGIAESFLFNGFHEMVHNTAFSTQALNSVLAEVLGFFNFRGAKWFWCFHWTHHRFTNDPVKDPELSGESLDLEDPTRSAAAYAAFLSGYPFGFERIHRMYSLAVGRLSLDPWVADKPPATQRFVRIEAGAFCAGYAALALLALAYPSSVGVKLVLFWLLPHCLGAGHLRMYQFAEHRACQMGPYTDTNAWACARTTTTWWFYCKLAWQMPYHVEHHAYPNVPFHRLKAAHELVKAAYAKEGLTQAPSGCNPGGDDGYLALHTEMFRHMLGNHAAAAKAAKAA
uniref:Fatty acid desaturase domain-containing protein n=1 Tax=Pyrodinium bahamense TaxID=73915 RepID=A0A7S0AVL6_9DINO